MANLLHKPTLYNDPATAYLMRQSKAALADMLTEILRCEQESCDDPATAAAAEARLAGILSRRDRIKAEPKRNHAT